MQVEAFKQQFHVRWSDLDPNLHVRHSAYADYCAATRFSFLDSMGFTMAKFSKLKVGPVIFNENISYLAEIRPGDQVLVDLRIAGLSRKGHKWKMVHNIYRVSDHKLAATLEISGAWFDLVNRKVTLPPDDLQKTIDQMPRSEDFTEL